MALESVKKQDSSLSWGQTRANLRKEQKTNTVEDAIFKNLQKEKDAQKKGINDNDFEYKIENGYTFEELDQALEKLTNEKIDDKKLQTYLENEKIIQQNNTSKMFADKSFNLKKLLDSVKESAVKPTEVKSEGKTTPASAKAVEASGSKKPFGTTVKQTEAAASAAALPAKPEKVVNKVVTDNKPAKTTDSKDDGNISFGEKAKAFVGGVGNFFKGMFCDEKGFSLGRTAATVGTVAAVTAAAAGFLGATAAAVVASPVVIVGAAVVGTAIGATQLVKGVMKANNAKTDNEAKNAYSEMGSGTTGIALSLLGAKAGLKMAGKTSGSPVGEFTEYTEVSSNPVTTQKLLPSPKAQKLLTPPKAQTTNAPVEPPAPVQPSAPAKPIAPVEPNVIETTHANGQIASKTIYADAAKTEPIRRIEFNSSGDITATYIKQPKGTIKISKSIWQGQPLNAIEIKGPNGQTLVVKSVKNLKYNSELKAITLNGKTQKFMDINSNAPEYNQKINQVMTDATKDENYTIPIEELFEKTNALFNRYTKK
ncbi:MAG: hypothetical protein WCG23_01720 [bacterium]